MSDTSPSTTIVPTRPDEGMLERLALVGFLAGYSGPTRDSYGTDLRLAHRASSAAPRRPAHPHRTLYGRWLEEQGRARATVGRRLSTLAGFYRYCADRRTTMRYDRARYSLDRHPRTSCPPSSPEPTRV